MSAPSSMPILAPAALLRAPKAAAIQNRLRAGPVVARTAPIVEQLVAQAPEGLRQRLVAQRLTIGDVAQLRHALTQAPQTFSFADILRLLPPKVAAKILQARSDSLHKMLLAWGKSLRKHAALDKKAHERRQAAAYQLKSQLQAQMLRRRSKGPRGLDLLAEAAAAADRLTSIDTVSLAQKRPLGAQLALGGPTAARAQATLMAQALTAPLPMGFSARGATLRLRSVAI